MRAIRLPTCEKGTFAPRTRKLDGIVVHYTATSLPRAMTVRTENEKGFIKRILKRAVDLPGLTQAQADEMWALIEKDTEVSDALRLCIQAAGLPRTASWNYCIGSYPLENNPYTVDVVEFVPPQFQSHHVGPLGGNTVNRTVGIECCYPGPYPRKYSEAQAEAYFQDLGWPKPTLLPGPDGVKRWFPEIHPAQFDALTELCVSLCTDCPDIYWIGGHYQFAPKRRIDPDPPISLSKLRDRVSSAMQRPLKDKP